MADNVMLTTIDNPFDPFTQFDDWFEFDESSGYHSTALLARVVDGSDELSDADQELALEQGIDEIVSDIGPNLYRKVKRSSS